MVTLALEADGMCDGVAFMHQGPASSDFYTSSDDIEVPFPSSPRASPFWDTVPRGSVWWGERAWMRQTGWICPISQDMAGGICWRDTVSLSSAMSHFLEVRYLSAILGKSICCLCSRLVVGGGWSGSNSLRAAGGLGTRGVKGPLFSPNAH